MKTFLERNNLIKLTFFIFLIFIPFGTKKFIYSFVPGVHELTAVFLYASDLFLILFLGLFFYLVLIKKNDPERDVFSKEAKTNLNLLILFVILAAVSILFAGYKFLALYQFVHLALGVFLAFSVGFLLKINFLKTKAILAILAISALFESLLAFLQFKFQGSVGLSFLGESVASPFIKGTSKISIAGGTLLRAFGTMPHANILAAFLVLGLICLCFFIYKLLKNLFELLWLSVSSSLP